MSKRNREKRAAKKRARPQRGPTPPRDEFGDVPPWPGGDEYADPPPPPSAEQLANTLLAVARTGDPDEASACAAELANGQFARNPHAVGTAAGMILTRTLGVMWRGGWLPADLWEITRRRVDAVIAGLLVDMIAADTAQHAAQTVHERWAAQVRQLDADVWWKRDRPHLPQWAHRHRLTVEHALLATITLLAELVTLPRLPQIVPPPGSAVQHATAAVGVDQKILSRVRALLAKAESTQFPEEAEALSAKAQELMNRHAFERALLDADEHRPQAATSTRLWLDAPYLEAKSQLVAAIAAANRCKAVFHPDLGFVALIGDQLDLDITEVLATSLLVQATRAMVAEGSQTSRTGTSRTRSFRQSFLVAYAARIGERLQEAAGTAAEPQADERLLPVLADRSRVVEETFQEMYHHTVQKAVSVTNGAGWHAGRAAADRADLDIERSAVSA
ncbi:DUF2786 domain-containing protein [Pseudonocardia sp. MH-G8]|uniref:DUF2786 domain-containing protein n=1 Tax=Pseudonocardia sp. MH-G8 TaxID=1854588 RepID=UPI000BA12E97|nr:DUF2786 domain-containing protein [Pseudonocardia sp. MH-G8]OZM79683.1 hypothetical protein CFP66_24245 [Pseudonocardia sp. MH-G8]